MGLYRIAPNSEMGYYDKIVLGSVDSLTKGKCIRYRHTRFDGKKVAERDWMHIPVTPTVIPADGKVAGYLPAPKDATTKFAEELASKSAPVQMPTIEEEIGLTDLASGLFGMQIKVAEPVKTQPKPQVTTPKPAPKPANKSAKVLKFPYTKSLYVNEKLIKNVDCVREYANRYEFMYTGNVVYTISKGEVNTVAGNSVSIFISTK